MCCRLRLRFLLFASFMMVMSVTSFAQFAITVSFGPPALPVYEQPLCPGEGYIWTPGYWAYDDSYGDYYWVPGTWILAPEVGYLWTPPYWGWDGRGYLFHQGYWGPQVGFYGGIVYGFGYFGHGYEGGRWDHDRFYYNRSVNNINVNNVHNVYNTTVVNNYNTVNRVSYNGGQGGVTAQPTAAEEAVARERHVPPVAAQTQHAQVAASNPRLRATDNQGKPPVAATARPGEFSGGGVVRANAAGAPYHPPANRQPTGSAERGEAPHPGNTPAAHPENNVPQPPPSHARDLSPHPQPTPPNTGNAKTDQKYQQQQQKLYTQQQQEHQKLAQQQEQEHQKAAQQHANAAHAQQMEQQHQQQTQQMEQRHAQQQQQLNTRQAPPPSHNEARPPAEKH